MKTEKNNTMKMNLKLIKKLINKVINYNLKTGAHIFINYAPHCNQIGFSVYDTTDKKWVSKINCHSMQREIIYYDKATEDVQEKINQVEKWLL